MSFESVKKKILVLKFIIHDFSSTIYVNFYQLLKKLHQSILLKQHHDQLINVVSNLKNKSDIL